MKFRKGFVSNSSSTSFCIIGKYFENSELSKMPKDKWGDPNLNELGFQHHYDQCGDGVYIGICADKWAEMDISFTELKKLLAKKFDEAGLEHNNQFGVHTDGWYDG